MAIEHSSVDLSDAVILEPTALADWIITAPVIVPLVAGALLLMIRHETRYHAGIAIGALFLALLGHIGLLNRVLETGPLTMTMGRWLPPFGISFTADVLGTSMGLAATLSALVCALYSLGDIGARGRRYGFYGFLMLMMAGVNGAFITGDIFNMYVWFEVFLISSFGLLVLGSERQQLDGATKYAVLNLLGTTLFLTATALLYGAMGTLNMADIARAMPQVQDSIPAGTLATLFFFAFAMKAAAFPVNFWLPASYHTPRIAASALFGGVLTKIGVYALLRTLGMLMPDQLTQLSSLIAWVAAATMIIGVMGALAQTDLRRILGFIVISGVGTMMAGLALGSAEGFSGAIFYAFHSILVMTALYLLAGVMNGLAGTYSLRTLSGLYTSHPVVAAFAFLLFLAVSGLPPASGLWPKVMLIRAAIDGGAPWLAFAILVSSLLTMLAIGRVFLLAVWRPAVEPSATVTVSPILGYAGLLILAVPIVWMGVYPEPFAEIANSAAAGLTDTTAYIRSVFPEGVQ